MNLCTNRIEAVLHIVNELQAGHLRMCNLADSVMLQFSHPLTPMLMLSALTYVLPELCRCHCSLCHIDCVCRLQVPSASTLCVVNLTATEAKVEVLTSDFVQLRPEAAQGGAGDEDGQDDCFMYDDDDNYQYEVSRMHHCHVCFVQSTCLTYSMLTVLPMTPNPACCCSGMPNTGMRCDDRSIWYEALVVHSREVHRQRARTTRQAQPQQAEPRS